MSDDRERRARFERFFSEFRSEREHPWWRPGAMRPEERERLVRIGLGIVLGDRADEIRVRRGDEDTIWATDGTHGFGFPIDTVLGDDPRTVMEHDLERLVDELCETRVAWAKRLPECPLHPDSHPLGLVVTDDLVTATCPVAGETVRSARY